MPKTRGSKSKAKAKAAPKQTPAQTTSRRKRTQPPPAEATPSPAKRRKSANEDEETETALTESSPSVVGELDDSSNNETKNNVDVDDDDADDDDDDGDDDDSEAIVSMKKSAKSSSSKINNEGSDDDDDCCVVSEKNESTKAPCNDDEDSNNDDNDDDNDDDEDNEDDDSKEANNDPKQMTMQERIEHLEELLSEALKKVDLLEAKLKESKEIHGGLPDSFMQECVNLIGQDHWRYDKYVDEEKLHDDKFMKPFFGLAGAKTPELIEEYGPSVRIVVRKSWDIVRGRAKRNVQSYIREKENHERMREGVTCEQLVAALKARGDTPIDVCKEDVRDRIIWFCHGVMKIVSPRLAAAMKKEQLDSYLKHVTPSDEANAILLFYCYGDTWKNLQAAYDESDDKKWPGNRGRKMGVHTPKSPMAMMKFEELAEIAQTSWMGPHSDDWEKLIVDEYNKTLSTKKRGRGKAAPKKRKAVVKASSDKDFLQKFRANKKMVQL